MKYALYIRNLNYAHLTHIFRQHNIWKIGFKREFQDFWCTNINNHLHCSEKTINTNLKGKNSIHATRISSFIFAFIVYIEKNQMLKYIFPLKWRIFWCRNMKWYFHCPRKIAFLHTKVFGNAPFIFYKDNKNINNKWLLFFPKLTWRKSQTGSWKWHFL